MKLKEMSMKDLLALHNGAADKPAGPKTFASKGKLIARIEALKAAGKLAQTTSGQAKKPKANKTLAQPKVTHTEAVAERAEAGAKVGIGALARTILMDPMGYPHALIAAMVNAQIEGAAATAKSVRWYACDMRKRGLDVPPRAKVHPAYMDEEQSAEWLKSVRVVETAPSDD